MRWWSFFIWNDLSSYDYKSIVFTTSGGPFKDDYSDQLMAKIIPNLPDSCKHLVLISAYGVGNSLNNKEVGINIMNNWYLKDTELTPPKVIPMKYAFDQNNEIDAVNQVGIFVYYPSQSASET